MKILAIDPGSTESAYCIFEFGKIVKCKKVQNTEMLWEILMFAENCIVSIEKIASYGMPVGETVFETVFWSGKFALAAETKKFALDRTPRSQIKMHLCAATRAKDANIRQVLLDRFGKPGTKKKPGATYGITKDCWAALALAVTVYDRIQSTEELF
jgi:hypothetical protein